jgi:N-acetylglucosaminyldiphosphoundecaprenol N-acetyl-beta-D-mannosaminyltransferase
LGLAGTIRPEGSEWNHSTTSIGGVPIANLDYEGFLDRIDHWVRNGESQYICVVPAASIVEAVFSRLHRAAVNLSGLNSADGMPLVWTQRLLGHGSATRVYGPELTLRTLDLAANRAWRVAFYGGHPERLQEMTRRMQARFKNLNIVEAISPPFGELADAEDDRMLERLREARPDVLFVGLGCPKQERWMVEHIDRLPCVMLGVGAAFDFHAGAVRQAPPALQRFGLEWAFRLACEPRRLWKRYLTTNPVFACIMLHHVARHWLNKLIRTGRSAAAPAPTVSDLPERKCISQREQRKAA